MSGFEQLDQLGGRSMEFIGQQQVHVIFRGRVAHISLEGDVGGWEFDLLFARKLIGSTAEIGEDRGAGASLAIVAANAITVQDGLDFTVKTETPHRAIEGFDPGRGFAHRQSLVVVRGGGVQLFVAADTGLDLAGPRGSPTAHQGHGAAFFIEWLQGDGLVSGHHEVGRAVGFDRHGADDPFDIPGAINTDAVHLAADVVIGEVVGEKPQLLDRAPRHVLEAGSLVDVHDLETGVGFALFDGVGNNGGARRPLHGHWFQQRKTGLLFYQSQVIEHVHQVDSPEGFLARFAGGEDVFFAQGDGVQELGPGSVHQVVPNNRLDLPAEPRNALHYAVRFEAAQGRIQDDQLPHARHTVVTADNTDDLARMAGHGFGVKEGVGPVGATAVVLALVGAVGVHGEQDPRHVMGEVGVLPTEVKHAAIGHDGGAPIVLLVKSQAADLARVRPQAIHLRHVRGAADAWHSHEGRGGGEQDGFVGQVAGRVVIYVRVGDQRELPSGPRAEVVLEDRPAMIAGNRREQKAAGLKVQRHVPHKDRLGGLENGVCLGRVPEIMQEEERVIDAGARQGAVALPILGQSQVARFRAALDDQEAIEVQQRISQQRFADLAHQDLRLGPGLGLAVFQLAQDRLPAVGKLAEKFGFGSGLTALRPGLGHIGQGPPERFGINELDLFNQAKRKIGTSGIGPGGNLR